MTEPMPPVARSRSGHEPAVPGLLLALLVLAVAPPATTSEHPPAGEATAATVTSQAGPPHIPFAEIYGAAARASAAYGSPEQIRRSYGEGTLVRHLAASDVRYFVTFDKGRRLQTITIRGTASIKDALVDARLVEGTDSLTGVVLHEGFRDATDELYRDLRDRLRNGYRTRIVGHSLGGAMAAVLMMHFLVDRTPLDRVITFGQPKVTDAAGAERFAGAPLHRVVDDRDMVHFLPPALPFGQGEGHYTHIGPEIVLLDGKQYLWHSAHRGSDRAESFWHNLLHESLRAHHIARYLGRLRPKVGGGLLAPSGGSVEAHSQTDRKRPFHLHSARLALGPA